MGARGGNADLRKRAQLARLEDMRDARSEKHETASLVLRILTENLDTSSSISI
jgi:hypothetical protein